MADSKDSVDQAIRAYLGPDMNGETGEMVTTWLLVAMTSTVDGEAATHVVPDRHLPRWQVKGALVHALDIIREGES